VKLNHDRYERIRNIFKRDSSTGKVDFGNFAQAEFEYLRNCQWNWTEKVDGMNVRVILETGLDVRGRSDRAQMPEPLMKRLHNEFDTEEVLEKTSAYGEGLCLYGEGFGADIQRGGRYGEQSFVMFDAMTNYGWASRRDMFDIAEKLHVEVVPQIFQGTIDNAIFIVTHGLVSVYGDFFAEGLVGRPVNELRDRQGNRIITKVKHRDFFEEPTRGGFFL
jgi:hypothetical protein